MAVSRRDFLSQAGLALGATALASMRVGGQGGDQGRVKDSGNLFAMDQGAAQSVQLPAKPNAHPQLTQEQRDELEHKIRCQCSCTLDVYTCRTTDFSCEVSPAMHHDIMGLVEGGYSAQEILDAFVGSYGERVLMAPAAKGFNLVGYVAPFLAVGAGAAILITLLRSWGFGLALIHP